MSKAELLYSQCVEDAAFASGKTDCHYLNSDWGCGGGVGTSTCCNPSATCENHICSLSSECVYSLPAPASTVPSTIASLSPVTAKKTIISLSPVLTASATPVSLHFDFGVPSSKPVTPGLFQLPAIRTNTYSICMFGDCSSSLALARRGSVCINKDNYYSQCLEDPQYKTISNTCVLLGSYGCSATKGCCNPATSCVNNVCIANVTGCWGSAPTGGTRSVSSVPSSPPTVRASSVPISTGAVCLYGDCTKNTAGCVAGSVCVKKAPFYSQCLEDPAFTTNATSACYGTGVNFGCGSTIGKKGCCNPSASCVNNFCMLSSSCK